MRPRRTWSVCALWVATSAGCGILDPPAGHDPVGAGPGAGGAAGSLAGAGTGGETMPSQAGNGGASGHAGGAGLGGSGGSTGGGASGTAATAGISGTATETGRLAGITAAHNAVRAAVDTASPLPPLVWSDKLAQYAQQWADQLAATSCSSPHHRSSQDLQTVNYGENLAVFISSVGGSTAQDAVNGWAAEKSCYTFGGLMTTDKCDTACYTALHSDGCGHYTQIVWRTSTSVGCGVATCQNGGKEDIWICNYSPPGNFVGRTPY